MSKQAVVKTTSNGHQQRYWINPETTTDSRLINLPLTRGNDLEPWITRKTSVPSNLFDRGVRWQDLPPSRLKDLIEDEMMYLADEYPSYDEFYYKNDGVFDIEIYGQCASVKLRSLNSDVRGLFLHGQCAVLAYAMYELTDSPIMVFSQPGSDEWYGHAGLATRDGGLLDITGFKTPKEIKEHYPEVSDPVVMSGEDFLALVKPDGSSFDDIGELERLVVMDFAQYALREVEGF